MSKLYPPQIKGTLPACIGGINQIISVPFIMNAMVSPSDISGFKIKIKTVSNNSEIGVLLNDIYSIGENKNNIVYFNQTKEVNLEIGQFYKIQMAYLNLNGEEGYYSTVGVIKATSKPEIFIEGFSEYGINALSSINLTGVYRQQGESADLSEKVYSYCFNIYDENDKLVDTSGEILHNSSYDVISGESKDEYSPKKTFIDNRTYKVEYIVKTANELIYKSQLYSFKNTNALQIDDRINFYAVNNKDCGCVDLYFGFNKQTENATNSYNGLFQFGIKRSCLEDGQNYWEDIYYFSKTIGPEGFSDFCVYQDKTVEQGKSYQYGIYQYNENITSTLKKASEDYEFIDFEDAFLFDKDKYLKLQFNPKVSSFKETLLESKLDTIGGKYPFIFRNGNVRYKEFSISGLISYLADENDMFLSSEEKNLDPNRDYYNRQSLISLNSNKASTTNLTGENIARERKFRDAVLDWLNDGKPKCFKSPTEGSFIVRLMNVSLSPNETLGRMLYTFTATAYEIADYNFNSIYKYVYKEELKKIRSQVVLTGELALNEMEENKFYHSPTAAPMYNVYARGVTSGQIALQVKYSDDREDRVFFISSNNEKVELGDNIAAIKYIKREANSKVDGSIDFIYYGEYFNYFDNIVNCYYEDVIGQQITFDQLEYYKEGVESEFYLLENGGPSEQTFKMFFITDEIVKATIDTSGYVTSFLYDYYLYDLSLGSDNYYGNPDGYISYRNGVKNIKLSLGASAGLTLQFPNRGKFIFLFNINTQKMTVIPEKNEMSQNIIISKNINLEPKKKLQKFYNIKFSILDEEYNNSLKDGDYYSYTINGQQYKFVPVTETDLTHALTENSELDTTQSPLLLYPNSSGCFEQIYNSIDLSEEICIGKGIQIDCSYNNLIYDYIYENENIINDEEKEAWSEYINYKTELDNYKFLINNKPENENIEDYWNKIINSQVVVNETALALASRLATILGGNGENGNTTK